MQRYQYRTGGLAMGSSPQDYTRRFPMDPYGQEMSDNARVWQTYVEEAVSFDGEKLDEYRDTIDVLLVFAGLFSAVLTTFVAQTSQNLQPNYGEASAILLLQLLITTTNGSQPLIPSSATDYFSPNRSDVWINSLCLITALVAVLVKQWMHQYVATVSHSSARNRARIRQSRYIGLEMWQVPMIVGLLPVLLHASLALFLIGLIIFLFSLDMKVAWLVALMSVATLFAYIFTIVLPLIHPHCPYKTPLTFYLYRPYRFARRVTFFIAQFMHRIGREGSSHPSCVVEAEHDHALKNTDKIDAEALMWLYTSTSNVSVHQIVLQSLAGVTLGSMTSLPDHALETFGAGLNTHVQLVIPHISSGAAAEALAELYVRAAMQICALSEIPWSMSKLIDRCSSEQLKSVLHCNWSVGASSVSIHLLGILRSPLRSSLYLHTSVWRYLLEKAYIDDALELQFIRILAAPASDPEEVVTITTIVKPTNEMREIILSLLSARWVFLRTMEISPVVRGLFQSDSVKPGDPAYKEREQLIDTTLVVFTRVNRILWDADDSTVGITLEYLFSVISSGEFSLDGHDDKSIQKIFATLGSHSWWIRQNLPRIANEQLCSHICRWDIFLLMWSLFSSGSLWIYGAFHEYGGMPALYDKFRAQALPQTRSRRNRPIQASKLADLYAIALLEHHQNEEGALHIDALFALVRLLAYGHHKSMLRNLAKLYGTLDIWRECLSRLELWMKGEEFQREWAFLDRLVAIHVLEGYEIELPKYDYVVCGKEWPEELAWLDGRLWEFSPSRAPLGALRCGIFSGSGASHVSGLRDEPTCTSPSVKVLEDEYIVSAVTWFCWLSGRRFAQAFGSSDVDAQVNKRCFMPQRYWICSELAM
ncbi:uncharacterized protein EV420DRAFT_1544337 [Desarmillaria tabescens]|uniref:DUF6535 domain-containing protein n=1 Tax=Armillaria tabescens TaxID=1929756 RepID=A0AA39N5K4_ARMTA|nr:uncharacterized protein EV420DRAFT_1544337 [Desarmillaria tabescens]KAK0458239.1 hypothetical protein EV420DRAFT_1544337 [Desarmillaria tabescens]